MRKGNLGVIFGCGNLLTELNFLEIVFGRPAIRLLHPNVTQRLVFLAVIYRINCIGLRQEMRAF